MQEFRDGADSVLEPAERSAETMIIVRDGRPVAVVIGFDEWAEWETFREHRAAASDSR